MERWPRVLAERGSEEYHHGGWLTGTRLAKRGPSRLAATSQIITTDDYEMRKADVSRRRSFLLPDGRRSSLPGIEMAGTGFEPAPENLGNASLSETGNAEYDALRSADEKLLYLIQKWPRLSDATKADILAIAQKRRVYRTKRWIV